MGGLSGGVQGAALYLRLSQCTTLLHPLKHLNVVWFGWAAAGAGRFPYNSWRPAHALSLTQLGLEACQIEVLGCERDIKYYI